MSSKTTWRHWRIDRDHDDIAWLTLDRADSGTNSLSREVLEELDDVMTVLYGEIPKALVIRSGKVNGFIAGADVQEFRQIDDQNQALELIKRGQAGGAR